MAKNQNETTVTFKVFNKEFKSGIKEMETAARGLRQELKLEQEQLKMTGSESQKHASDLSNLERQYDLAKQKTEATRKALAESKVLFGENSEAVKKMETELRRAEISEQQLANKVQVTSQKLEEAKAKESDRAQRLSKLKSSQESLVSSSEKLSKEYELQKAELGNNASASKKLKTEQDYLAKQMNNSADQVVNLSMQLTEAKEQFGANSKEVKQLEKDLLDAKIATVEFTNQFKDSTNGLKNFGTKAQSVGKHMTNVGKKLTLGITAPVLAFTAGLAKNGIEVRKFREQAGTFYEALYQDSQRAKQQLDDLMTFAKTTPFQYESIVEADQIMQTFGMSTERSKEVLGVLAETVAGTGQSSTELQGLAEVMGQIESSGKLSLEDMNQLVNRKIPAFKIVANEMGISVQELRDQISKGSVTSDQAISALTNGLLKGTDGINGATVAYEGSLSKVKKTLPGAVDSFKSALKGMSLDLINEDVFDTLIEAINKITTMLKTGDFTPIIESMSKAFATLVETIGNLAEWFGNLSPETQQMIANFVMFGAALGPILSIIGSLIGFLGSLSLFLSGPIAAAILPILPWIALAIAAIVAIVAVVKNWGAITDWVSKKWSDFIGSTKELLTGLGTWWHDFWGGLGTWFSDKWTEIATSASTIWTGMVDGIVGIWTGFTESIRTILSNLSTWFSEKWGAIKETTASIWKSITETTKPIIDGFVRVIMVPISLVQATLTFIWGWIKVGAILAWTGIQAAAAIAWNFIKDAIIAPIQAVYDWMIGKFTELGLWFSTKWTEIKEVAGSTWQGIKETIIQPVSKAKDAAVNKASEIWAGLTEWFGKTRDAASEKWQEVKIAISDRFTEAKDGVVSTASGIWTSVSETFGNVVEAVKEKFEAVKEFIMGPIRTARDFVGKIVEEILGFFQKIKLPKFSVEFDDKKIFGVNVSVPKFKVKWNAKGGIFNSPTIFGSNNGTLQGIGEAGREAALPLNKRTLGMIGQEIIQSLSQKEMMTPLLDGLVEAAQTKMTQTNQKDHTQNKMMEMMNKFMELLASNNGSNEVHQTVNVGSLNTNSLSEYDRLNQHLKKSAGFVNSGLRGDF